MLKPPVRLIKVAILASTVPLTCPLASVHAQTSCVDAIAYMENDELVIQAPIDLGVGQQVLGQDLESNRIYTLQVIAMDNSITERSWLKAISDKPAWIEIDEVSNMEYWHYSTSWSVCPSY